MLLEEGVEAAARLDDPGEARVGLGDRVDWRVGAVAVRVEVVVGEAEEEEVVGALADQLLADAGRVLVAGPGPAEGRLQPVGAAGVEVAVEELVGRPDRVAEVGGGGRPADQALEAELVAAAAAVDQERRGRGAHPGVAEALEHRLRLPAEVVDVHVVDEVVHRPEEAEGPGRLERGAVLDVAALDPVVPVHPHHPVAAGADAGHDLRASRPGSPRGSWRRSRRSARPRSSRAAKVGAPPAAIARRSIAGCSASTTTRTSFSAIREATLAEDPQALVLSLLPRGDGRAQSQARASRPPGRRAGRTRLSDGDDDSGEDHDRGDPRLVPARPGPRLRHAGGGRRRRRRRG